MQLAKRPGCPQKRHSHCKWPATYSKLIATFAQLHPLLRPNRFSPFSYSVYDFQQVRSVPAILGFWSLVLGLGKLLLLLLGGRQPRFMLLSCNFWKLLMFHTLAWPYIRLWSWAENRFLPAGKYLQLSLSPYRIQRCNFYTCPGIRSKQWPEDKVSILNNAAVIFTPASGIFNIFWWKGKCWLPAWEMKTKRSLNFQCSKRKAI